MNYSSKYTFSINYLSYNVEMLFQMNTNLKPAFDPNYNSAMIDWECKGSTSPGVQGYSQPQHKIDQNW